MASGTLELQAQIRSDTIQLNELAKAVDVLPESETRGELIYKHNKTLQVLANLQADLDDLDIKACYYGFTDNCPGIPCAICNEGR